MKEGWCLQRSTCYVSFLTTFQVYGYSDISAFVAKNNLVSQAYLT
jgi:hypothetical protein